MDMIKQGVWGTVSVYNLLQHLTYFFTLYLDLTDPPYVCLTTKHHNILL